MRFGRTLLPVIVLAAAGCMPSLESSEPPDRVYWLEPTEAASTVGVEVHVSVVPGLDDDRIRVLQPDRRLNYYAGAFWADSLAPLLQSVIDRSVNGTAKADRSVIVHVLIERFFAVESGAATPPEVELAARLRGGPDHAGACLVRTSSVAGSTRLRDIVAAHQSIADELAHAVGRFASTLAEGGAVSC
ncbi:MAG: ABC-type transport auxiliary lipoprotein family protein [Gammaproteobacteria bacterium]